MILLGVLAFIQLTILPGWLIAWRWRAPSWWLRVLVAFGLSLLFNHLLVLALVILGGFHQAVVLSVVGGEVLLLLGLLYKNHWAIVPRQGTISLPANLSGDLAAPRWLGQALFWLIVVGAASALLTIVVKVISLNPGVFNIWDDFVSFNRWAVDWYNGIVPVKTQLYPQLIPTNWALAYQIVGNSDIQFFVKAVMGVFPIAILTIFIDLFYRSKRAAFLLGLIFTTVLLLALSNVFIGSGYVDIPAAFFAFLACALLMPDLLARQLKPSHLVLAGVLAAAAALTKQGGLFMILPLLVWGGVIVWTQRKSWLWVLKWAGILLLTFGILIAPWYGYKLWQMRQGKDAPEIASVESALVRAIGERSLLEKWSYGVQTTAIRTSVQILQSAQLVSIDNSTPRWNISHQPVSRSAVFAIMWGLLLLLGLALISGLAGLTLVTVGLPFFLIWATKYSYDFRNLTLALPFLGMVLGFGLMNLIQLLTRLFGALRPNRNARTINSWVIKIKGLPYWVGALLLAATITVVCWQIMYPAPALYAMHEQKMRSVGMAGINEALYQYYETHGLEGKIRTMYLPLAYLPKLKDYTIAASDSLSLGLLKQFEQDPKIYYVLWWDGTNEPDALAYMKGQIDKKKYTAIFEVGNYRFVKIKVK